MRVHLVTPEPSWPARFGAIRDDLQTVLGTCALRIEHVGSTSIPMPAKPTIDIAVEVAGAPLDDCAHRLVAAMSLLWLKAFDEVPPPRRVLALLADRNVDDVINRVEVDPDLRVASITLWPEGSRSLDMVISFRDRLRIDAKARQRYELGKAELASRSWLSLRDYSLAKDQVITSILSHSTLDE